LRALRLAVIPLARCPPPPDQPSPDLDLEGKCVSAHALAVIQIFGVSNWTMFSDGPLLPARRRATWISMAELEHRELLTGLIRLHIPAPRS
jgi:hypothetical protein